MFCNKCGTSLPDATEFCSSCGAKQSAVSTAIPVSTGGAVNANDPATQAKIIYFLYLGGILTGGLTTIGGLVWAYLSRGEAEEWLLSHFNFLIGTFWKSLIMGVGLSLLLGVMMILNWVLLMLSPALGIFAMLATLIASLGGLALFVWFLVRCIKGLMILGKNQPIANPSIWMMPR